MRKQIDWSLETKGDKTVLLISSKSENHNQIVLSLLETLILKRDMGGVYITISRPSDSIIDTLDAKGVPSENVFFVDCISQMSGKLAGIKRENVTYVDNPSSLEEISMFLERLLVKIKGDGKFIVLDSLSSLLIYNSDKSVREFAHFIINRARMQNITAVILSIEKKEAEDLVKTLAPMCDSELKF
jgi:archaellum biogenesis ATPase FlaH